MKKRVPLASRSLIAFSHDIVMTALSFVLSLWLRLGDQMMAYVSFDEILRGAFVFSVIGAVTFWMMGLYRGIWRYASVSDLVAITKAVTLIVLLFVGIQFLWTRLEDLPRSLPLINWFLLMALLGGPRFLYRLAKDRRLDMVLDQDGRTRVPILLAGAGDGAELFLRATNRPGDANYRPVGILAETTSRVGRNIHGVEVLGTLDELARVCSTLEIKPTKVIVTKPDMDGALVRDLFDTATRLGMTLARMPRLTDFKSESGTDVPLREIAVEDLLGRPQKPLDRDAMRDLVHNKRVLVTGAGGSIGSELSRQAADFGPAELVLVENSEFALYTIDMELSRIAPDTLRRAVICDVRDRSRLDSLFDAVKPDIIFHAAALKHVPLVEANVAEGLHTNVLGTANVAEAAVTAGVATMVMISTDKAVNPTNVMGASKRIAEQYVQALDLHQDKVNGTRFVTVRFGNVLGSTGSVVPLFRKQLADGGPLTVTHPDMTRYFMTIREAVELVLQAAAFDVQTGHANNGKIYVLNMGEPVKIIDLARQMIRLAGFEPDTDIAIDIVGPRPGEKLFEEVFHGSEPPIATDAPGILLAAPRTGDIAVLRAALDELSALCHAGNEDGLAAFVHKLVPEYKKA